jgi:hypothetical protein
MCSGKKCEAKCHTPLFSDIEAVKSFLLWCKANGIPHVEIESLKADVIISEGSGEEPGKNREYAPTNLDYIPSFAPDFIDSPLQVEEVIP